MTTIHNTRFPVDNHIRYNAQVFGSQVYNSSGANVTGGTAVHIWSVDRPMDHVASWCVCRPF